MDVNARREGARCKNAVGEKQYALFRSGRRAFSFRCIQQTRFEIRDIRRKKAGKPEKKRNAGEGAERQRGRKTMEKLRGCARDFVAACLRAFTLTFSDTSNLFRENGKWNISEVPRRPLARRYSICISLLRTSVYLDLISRALAVMRFRCIAETAPRR